MKQQVALVALVVADYDEALAFHTGKLRFTVLQTDDLWRHHRAMTDAGVSFVRPPSVQPYETVAVFEDPYGNRWGLVQFGGPA